MGAGLTLSVGLVMLLTGCSGGAGPHEPGDAGRVEIDAGRVAIDAGREPDTGRAEDDAGAGEDAGAEPDSGPGVPDSGRGPDAGPRDAGPLDGGPPDAGPLDGGPPDAECRLRLYRDADGDGFGDDGDTILACAPRPGYVPRRGDCDDTDATVHPAAFERCDCPTGVPRDEDCDGAVDESCSCTCGSVRACGLTEVGACTYGVQMCVDGAWAICMGAVLPTSEVCNGADDDCDGTTDEKVCP